uniref:Uncharacterized protein n=1 Tax=viral metagenome TaxID=1070528 RepID=A0A6M3ILI7_9ZZZZ
MSDDLEHERERLLGERRAARAEMRDIDARAEAARTALATAVDIRAAAAEAEAAAAELLDNLTRQRAEARTRDKTALAGLRALPAPRRTDATDEDSPVLRRLARDHRPVRVPVDEQLG